MAETKILTCSCEHNYQDSKYGKNKRLHNVTRKKKGENFLSRCTVCGNEK